MRWQSKGSGGLWGGDGSRVLDMWTTSANIGF